ncbi:MAG: MtnX-like HAD-IB family phosphatase [candidate division KSB1 bacterium]|nr:MtnX-like HAD-IB family phosphatase [candidate division KSB1 bacterium]
MLGSNRATPARRLILFCDFDGTVAQNDVGDLFFQTFAGIEAWQAAVEAYRSGQITSREYLERVCAATRFDSTHFEKLVREQPLDPHFRACVQYCRQHGYPVYILSDGLDAYIRRILENNGLADLPVFSNRMIQLDTIRIVPHLPYWEHSCGDCANCKGYHIRRLRKPGDLAVFVGDGISDRCAVREADRVLAKGTLRDWCQAHGYSFRPVESFADVLREIQALEEEAALTVTAEPYAASEDR